LAIQAWPEKLFQIVKQLFVALGVVPGTASKQKGLHCKAVLHASGKTKSPEVLETSGLFGPSTFTVG